MPSEDRQTNRPKHVTQNIENILHFFQVCFSEQRKFIICFRFSFFSLFTIAGYGLFALNIVTELLSSGTGESGSECCNEFINFPQKCQQLQCSFSCCSVTCSLNGGVSHPFYSPPFPYLPLVLESLH